jgi:hypothetical protein
MYPSSSSSIQLIFGAKFIKFVGCYVTVITTDKLKYNPFCLQHSIWGGMAVELLDALVNGSLFFFRWNSVFV